MTLQDPLIDDIAFALSISSEIGALYKSAKEYSVDLPDYSLGRLRGLAQLVCDLIAKTSNMSFPQGCNLVKKIDDLFRKRVIAEDQENLLHALREGGNSGVHPEKYYLSAQEWVELAEKNLVNARTLLQFTFQCLHPFIPLPCYQVSTVDPSNLKTLCYQAMFEADPQAQHLTGKLFLGKAEAYEKKFIESLPPGGGYMGPEFSAFKKQAFFWFSQAADTLYPPSMYEYGRALADGLEGEGEKWQGEMLVNRASQMGHADANAFIGGCYLHGSKAFDVDYEEARRHLELAAAEDHPFALANLGAMHQKGWGGPADQIAAAAYTQKAAEAGYPQGQYNLSVLYAQGLGVERNDLKSLEWLSKAASQHYPHAMLILAEMAVRGQVPGQGPEQAELLFYRCLNNEQSGNQARYGLARLLFFYHSDHQRSIKAAHLLQECYEREGAVGTLAQKCWDLAPEVIAQIKLGMRIIKTDESVEQAMAILPYFDLDGHPYPSRKECLSQLLVNLKQHKVGMPPSAALVAQLTGGMVSGFVDRLIKPPSAHRLTSLKVGRNSICPSCDSGKKYKVCCGR